MARSVESSAEAAKILARLLALLDWPAEQAAYLCGVVDGLRVTGEATPSRR